MSVLRSLSVLALFTTGLSGAIATQITYAQTNTGSRPAAKPKATKPIKRAPVRRPAPAPPQSHPGTFAVPQLEEDNWYNLEKSETQLSDSGAKENQLGVVGVVNYFGAGGGVEYVRSFAPFGVAVTGLYTVAKLKDNLTASGQEQGESVEFFDTKSTYLRVHGRYNFYRYVYFSSGLTFDRIQGNYGWRGTAIQSGEIKTDFSSALMTLDLMIGSEFRGPWGTYIGVDWLGTSIPLSSSVTYKDNSDLDLTSRALKGKKPDQRIEDETSAQLRIYYLNLRIGYTF